MEDKLVVGLAAELGLAAETVALARSAPGDDVMTLVSPPTLRTISFFLVSSLFWSSFPSPFSLLCLFSIHTTIKAEVCQCLFLCCVVFCFSGDVVRDPPLCVFFYFLFVCQTTTRQNSKQTTTTTATTCLCFSFSSVVWYFVVSLCQMRDMFSPPRWIRKLFGFLLFATFLLGDFVSVRTTRVNPCKQSLDWVSLSRLHRHLLISNILYSKNLLKIFGTLSLVVG